MRTGNKAAVKFSAHNKRPPCGVVFLLPQGHTYVTRYYIKHKNDPDFDLAKFSKSIGHSGIRTTMGICAHPDMTQNRFVQRSMIGNLAKTIFVTLVWTL